jgi:hypothetical protein
MKTSVSRQLNILFFVFIGLTSGAALGWENCLSKLKQTTQAKTAPEPLEVFQKSEQEGSANVFTGKKLIETRTPEQLAAAALKCYSALHRDLADGLAEGACQDDQSTISAGRGQAKTAY